MRTIINIALCAASGILLSSCFTLSKRIRYYDVARLDSLGALPVDVAAYDRKYGEYNGVYLLSDRVYQHWGAENIRGIGFAKVSTHRYLVLDPHDDDLTTFSLEIQGDQTLEGAGIVVRSPDGAHQRYDLDAMKVSGGRLGSHIYKLAIPNVTKGTVITTMYAMYQPAMGTLDDEVSLQFSLPCERMDVTYASPSWWSTDFKRTADSDGVEEKFHYEHNLEMKTKTVSYHADSVAGYRSEIYSPYFKEIAPSMSHMLRSALGSPGYKGYTGWREMTEGIKRFTSNDYSFWTRAGDDLADSVTAHCGTKMEKLDSIVAFVGASFALASTELTSSAGDVIEKRQGNPILLSALTRGMLEHAGIEASLVLIHDASDGYFDKSYFDPGQIYTTAVRARVNNESYLILPYIKGATRGVLPEYLQGQPAMAISLAGENDFFTTPITPAAKNRRTDDYAITLDESGALEVTQSIELTGEMAFLKRREIDDIDEDQLKRAMKEMLDYDDGDILNFSYEIDNRYKYGEPLSIKLHYSIDNLVTVTPDEVVMQTGGLFSPATRNKNKVDVDERVTPIHVYSDEELDKKITIRFPESWSLASAPPNVEKSSMFGSVKGSYKEERGMLEVEHHRTLLHGKAGPEKFNELLTIIGSRSVLNVPSLVFKRAN